MTADANAIPEKKSRSVLRMTGRPIAIDMPPPPVARPETSPAPLRLLNFPPPRGGGGRASFFKREIFDVNDVQKIVLPALDPRADQVLGDAEVVRQDRQFLQQNLFRLRQQLRTFALIACDRGLIHKPVI